MPAPPGASEIRYSEDLAYNNSMLRLIIGFYPTDATMRAVRTWFEVNGWRETQFGENYFSFTNRALMSGEIQFWQEFIHQSYVGELVAMLSL